MASELDVLLEAIGENCLVVDKDSNVLWNRDDLLACHEPGLLSADGRITLPDEGATAVTSIFPGCMSQVGAPEDYSRYVPVGQTKHFLVFAKRECTVRN
jgi:hypothetical protein